MVSRTVHSLITYLLFDSTVEKNGDVCISILHDPGEDKWGYERPEERWLPIHTVETIIMSVISMISDPNDQSPANVDAAVSGYGCLHLQMFDAFRKNGGMTIKGPSRKKS